MKNYEYYRKTDSIPVTAQIYRNYFEITYEYFSHMLEIIFIDNPIIIVMTQMLR